MDSLRCATYFNDMSNAEQILNKGWNERQVREWHASVIARGKVRDYETITSRVTRLPANTHTVETYGVLSGVYPLYRITVGDVRNGKPNVGIVGTVHGYEPSGVEAALRFTREEAPSLTNEFNFVVYPCFSPWAFEYDQRWNEQAEDPNRLLTRKAITASAKAFRTYDIEECRYFMTSMEQHQVNFACVTDLHETCDRDIELRILRAERFDEDLARDYREIPQGYYLTLSKRETAGENGRQLLFGQSIIDEVQKVSPIAPEATILNGKVNYGGVILSPPVNGTMRTYLDDHARLVAVTEVYPDHADMSPERAVQAQLASIRGALNHLRAQPS